MNTVRSREDGRNLGSALGHLRRAAHVTGSRRPERYVEPSARRSETFEDAIRTGVRDLAEQASVAQQIPDHEVGPVSGFADERSAWDHARHASTSQP